MFYFDLFTCVSFFQSLNNKNADVKSQNLNEKQQRENYPLQI